MNSFKKNLWNRGPKWASEERNKKLGSENLVAPLVAPRLENTVFFWQFVSFRFNPIKWLAELKS